MNKFFKTNTFSILTLIGISVGSAVLSHKESLCNVNSEIK
jgi:hypothetical protein